MLKSCKNPYDVLKQLPAAFGTVVNPQWCLLFNNYEDLWSAMDCHSSDDLIEVAMSPNWRPICVIPPAQLGPILEHERPDLICNSLRSFVLDSRPKASDVQIAGFMPVLLADPPPDPEPVS